MINEPTLAAPTGEDWSEYIAPQAVAVDTDLDGRADAVLVDDDADGVADAVLLDTDDDLVGDTVIQDAAAFPMSDEVAESAPGEYVLATTGGDSVWDDAAEDDSRTLGPLDEDDVPTIDDLEQANIDFETTQDIGEYL